MIYNVVIVSGVQQSESHGHVNIFILSRFSSLIAYHRILHIELLVPSSRSLLTSVSYVVGCICSSQTPDLSLPPCFPFGIHKFVFDICTSTL